MKAVCKATPHPSRPQSAGANAAAIAPPEYGIDFADRVVQRRPLKVRKDRWEDWDEPGAYATLSELLDAKQAAYREIPQEIRDTIRICRKAVAEGDLAEARFNALVEYFEGGTGSARQALLWALREYLSPDELAALLEAKPKTSQNIRDFEVEVPLQVVRLNTVKSSVVHATIAAANEILKKENITLTVASETERNDLAQTYPRVLSSKGNYQESPKDKAALQAYLREQKQMIEDFAKPGGPLTVMWFPDFTGFGFLGEPEGITTLGSKGKRDLPGQDLVIMKAKSSGQTLAHEIGHCLGEALHGEHIDTGRNLMHSDPFSASKHTNLLAKQVAAFKGSDYVRLKKEKAIAQAVTEVAALPPGLANLIAEYAS